MTDPAITALIKEVLAEELQRIGRDRHSSAPENRREEVVKIATSDDLMAFAQRVLRIADDRNSRSDLEKGRLVFRLADQASPASGGSTAPGTANTISIESGVISERQVNGLPKGTERLFLGKQVRLTPLARDRLRQRGIKIERTG